MPKGGNGGGNGGGGKGGGGGSLSLTILGVTPDTGSDSSDGITNESSGLVLSGTGTWDGVTEVFVYIDGVKVGSVPKPSDNGDGTYDWSFDLPDGFLDGTYEISIGTESTHPKKGTSVKVADSFSLTIDTDIATPTITGVSADTGADGSDGVTQDNSPVISGTAEAGAEVEVFVGGQSRGTVLADATGTWSFTIGDPLADGVYSVTATATDAAGNSASTTSAYNLTVDTIAPGQPQVTEVLMADETTVATDGVTDDDTPRINGTAEAGSTVEVFIDGNSIGTVTADENGDWTIVAAVLGDALYTVTAQATDLAGNTSILSSGFEMEVDAVPDDDPPSDPPPEEPAGDTFTPDDPLYAEQWHLGMLGDIETIWAEFTGAGALVGVYDDGIQYDHVDLNDNYDATKHLSYGGSELDPYPTTDTEAVHGTAVAGVIAAEANGVGTVGVAWGATLVGVNIFSGPADINASDKTGFYAASDEQWQFDVVNHSWGSAPNFSNDVSAVTLNVIEDWEHATATGRGGLGTLVVKAAGNDGDNAQGDFLNAVRHSITVGAYALNWGTGLTDASWYTNRGANVLVSAPSSGMTIFVSGTEDLHSSSDLRIATTDRDGEFGYADDSWSSSTDLSGFGGTSSAAPVVSGVLALMLDANESLGWRDAQEILAYSAHHLGGPIGGTYTEIERVPENWLVPGGSSDLIEVPVEYFGWNWNGADNWNGGGLHFSEDYGYGGVDAYNAVRMAEVWSMFGPAQVTANEVSASTAAMTPALSVDTDDRTATPASASYEFTYSGAAMDLEYVDIAIVLSSTYLKEVTLEITSPEGTTVTLMAPLINDFLPDLPGFPVNLSWTFGAQAFRGEDPNGQWIVTLTETDLAGDDWWFGGATGNTLDELQLTFHGGAASDDDVYHYTSEMLSLGLTGDADRVALDDSGGTDWLNMAAMPEDLVVDLATDGSGGASVAGGATFVDIASGTQIEHAVTGDGNDSLTGNGLDNKLYGMRGDDDIMGLDGNDTLRGGPGSDNLWGGLGDDLFEFHLGDEIDWIWDFTAGAGSEDTIALHGTGFMTFSSLSSIFSDDGGNAVIDFGNGDSIILADISSSQLHEDDFLFYA